MAALAPPTNTRNAIDKAEIIRNPHDLLASQLVNYCPLRVNAEISGYLACALTYPSGRMLFRGGIPSQNRLTVEAYSLIVVRVCYVTLAHPTEGLISRNMKGIMAIEMETSRFTHGFDLLDWPRLSPNHLTQTRGGLQSQILAALVW